MTRTADETLILHWDGHTWSRVASPNPSATYDSLYGVASASSTDVWAVGQYTSSSNEHHTLVLHWNGTTWRHAAAPNLGISAELDAVDAHSATDARAVGSSKGPLLLHWNGTKWRKVQPPPGLSSAYARGVAGTGPSNAFAVGYSDDGPGHASSVILRWNGTSWAEQ